MMYHRDKRAALCLSLSAFALFPFHPANAQGQSTESASPSEDDPATDDLHDRRVDTQGRIVVTGTNLRQLDVLAGTSVVEGAELQRNLDGQIGEVLASTPGVSATSFSPGASRPVLRGFSGERVKVLVDGIGAIDVSNTSADHATSIDPLTAERIEVLRGPAVLLYGSQAIGGAVNVVDKRIPLRQLAEPFHVDALVGADTASHLREAGASLDLPAGGGFVFHADGSYRRTDDLEVADYVLAPVLRDEVLAEADEEAEEGHVDEAAELRELADQRGVLPNSATETFSANAGFAFFGATSSMGASFGVYDTAYGVPMRPGAGHAHAEEDGSEEEGEAPVSIALRQYRADFRGKLDLGDGFFSALNTRVGFSDYTHTEFEGDEIGTVFDVTGIEARAVFDQKEIGSWLGSTGIQYYTRDFDAFGAEAYVPKNLTDQFAVFSFQEFAFDPLQLELAGRYETTTVKSQPLGFERSFDTLSGAVGLIYETASDLRVGVTGSRAERAPSAEELLSNGPHIATQAFEIGDPALTKESAWGLEGFVRGRIGEGTINIAVFRNWFSDYIYLAETGEEEDGLPVFRYRQGDVDYAGVEGEITYPVYRGDNLSLSAELRGDYVAAELADGTPLPRIPPLRLAGALEAEAGAFDLRGEVEWFDRQDKVAGFETPTASFTHVNASLAWRPLSGNDSITLMLQANNILDADGRRHASFTKDFVPLPGRNFKLSARASF